MVKSDMDKAIEEVRAAALYKEKQQDKTQKEHEVNRLCDELLAWLDLRYGGNHYALLCAEFEHRKLTFRTLVKSLLEAYTS